MSIAPPSDIILDVAQAAEPARRQAAVSKLAAAAAGAGAARSDFDVALSDTAPAPSVTSDASLLRSPLTGAGRSQVTAGHGSVYQKFEAMVLQNFVENILPKDTSLYGDAASADMCRSMMAGKLAEQLAKSGRIGIAKSIERYESHVAAAPAPLAAGKPQGQS